MARPIRIQPHIPARLKCRTFSFRDGKPLACRFVLRHSLTVESLFPSDSPVGHISIVRCGTAILYSLENEFIRQIDPTVFQHSVTPLVAPFPEAYCPEGNILFHVYHDIHVGKSPASLAERVVYMVDPSFFWDKTIYKIIIVIGSKVPVIFARPGGSRAIAGFPVDQVGCHPSPPGL